MKKKIIHCIKNFAVPVSIKYKASWIRIYASVQKLKIYGYISSWFLAYGAISCKFVSKMFIVSFFEKWGFLLINVDRWYTN